MLNDKLILSLTIVLTGLIYNVRAAGVAPILDIDNESMGYIGKIGERNILVDLKPHLEVKNIDQINGICSYHVFKPNNEEFPFTIDIKDKTTGEAVIEVVKKDLLESTTSSSTTTVEIFSPSNKKSTNSNKQPSLVLDCNKRKEFNFLIQAHDCSTPSLSSNKIPVKIEIVDHDDYVLKFDKDIYKKTLIKSANVYENFLQVQAKDLDCTNNGQACAYKLLRQDLTEVDVTFPFSIDGFGQISTTGPINKGDLFEFTVRAFDCINKNAFVDAKVIVDVIDECVPQWTDFSTDINPLTESTSLFDTIKTTSCDFQYQNAYLKPEQKCEIDEVKSKITFDLDPTLKTECQPDLEKCKSLKEVDSTTTTSTVVLFSVNKNKASTLSNDDDVDDDTIEDDDNSFEGSSDEKSSTDDENSIIKTTELKKPTESSTFNQQKQPINFRTFSKDSENAQKIEFDGSFGNEFSLSVWIRRPANADKNIKEQVFCGTDSHAMNRHHYGIYFYRGNFKFLLRKEPTTKSSDTPNEIFYPSLWEWSLYEPLLTDNKWHFYEVKFNYPNASLYIDGVKFVETTSNSDIIDAYELSDVKDSGAVTTYVGACYHSRTGTLLDHFEGDIADLVLTKKTRDLKKEIELKQQNELKCKESTKCNEYIEMNMVGNENFLSSIESSNQFEINVKSTNLDEMTQLVRKLNYINKNKNPKEGSRSIKLTTQVRCSDSAREIKLNDLFVNLNLKQQKQEYNVQLEGVKQLFTTTDDLENGMEPFRDVSIVKIPINKVDNEDESDDEGNNSESSEEQSEQDIKSSNDEASSSKNIQLSKCQIKILPQRNLMDPSSNNEKLMFLQNLLDQFGFKFEETLNLVKISGIQSAENYQAFIRKLTYTILNVNQVEQEKLKLIKNKQFYITCFRNEPNIETNTILVQLNLSRTSEQEQLNLIDNQNTESNGFIAHKQAQKLVVSDSDDDITRSRLDDALPLRSSLSSKSLSPTMIAVIVLASCVVGFILVFGVIKLHTSRFFQGGRRKVLINEENPQMEWDDSGLNITENPLDNLKMNKEYIYDDHENNNQLEYEGDEYTTSEDDEESNDDEDAYSSEEEPEKAVERELEWDDESLEIKEKKLQMEQQQQHEENELENNNCNNYQASNKFV